ncbi:MAG: hypothetical protein MAG451_02535 [Anaerolineales bacterium]|nr:hypothetical protein [Anaerolineales bacterium]
MIRCLFHLHPEMAQVTHVIQPASFLCLVLDTVDRRCGAFQGHDGLESGDLIRRPGQEMSPASPAHAPDEAGYAQGDEQLIQIIRRNMLSVVISCIFRDSNST